MKDLNKYYCSPKIDKKSYHHNLLLTGGYFDHYYKIHRDFVVELPITIFKTKISKK